MNKTNEFKLYNEIVKYSKYIRKHVISNIPTLHRDLRIHLMDEIYNLERNLVLAESTKGNIRIKYITEMQTNAKMLDILSSDIIEFCPNSKKSIEKSFNLLVGIRNMIYAWRNNPE